MDGLVSPPLEAPPRKVRFWKNPYVFGFLIGIAVLTLLPFLQRAFLRAPPPLAVVAPWQLATRNGGVVGSEALKGTVWLATVVPAVCGAACAKAHAAFGRALNHVDDFDGGIALVTFARPSTQLSPVEGLRPGRWYIAQGPGATFDEALQSFRVGFDVFSGRDGGIDAVSLTRVIALVDQNGALRGFWRRDANGLGNAINAARLLARYGPTP